jgi:transcription initiation factor TFIIB
MAAKTNRTGKQEERARSKSGFTCSECGGTEIVQDLEKGERICAACGLVISDHRIDTGPEWRAFTADEKDARSRTGRDLKSTGFASGRFEHGFTALWIGI